MKVSHRCPNCDAYNKVADGVHTDLYQMQFACAVCGAVWFRTVCSTCRGGGYFLDDPCSCDGGMEPETQIQYWMGIKAAESKPKFGEKSKPRTDFDV